MFRNRPVELDRTLGEFVPSHYTGESKDMFGIEIELEGRNVITSNTAINEMWKQTKDGSLRAKAGDPKSECIEYIFRRPYDMMMTQEALRRLLNYLTGHEEVVVFDSYRTSIHVHVNCLSETIRTVVNFITLAIIFDELFVSQNGQTRIGNNFCLRTRDAEGQVNDLINSINQYGTPFNVSSNNRYSSVNMASLSKFGTVEFRSLECTTDESRIMNWVKTLNAMKKAARDYNSPRDIVASFSQKGYLGFIIQNLGDQASLYAKIPGANEMLHGGMRVAQDFAFCSEWKVPEVTKTGKPVSKRSTRYGAKNMFDPAQLAAIYGNGPGAPQPDFDGWGHPAPQPAQVAPGGIPLGGHYIPQYVHQQDGLAQANLDYQAAVQYLNNAHPQHAPVPAPAPEQPMHHWVEEAFPEVEEDFG